MNPAICLLAVVPVRKEPAHRSEMVSQLIFGEFVDVLEKQEQFSHITCVYDGYEGWVQTSQLTAMTNILETTKYTSTWCEEMVVNNKKLRVPLASPVYDDFKAGNIAVSYDGYKENVWQAKGKDLNETDLLNIAEVYLETPYLWGGRSVFGIDCSGFVQQVFKFFDIRLLRDAYLQAGQGEAVPSVKEAQPCDLGFFQNDNGRITHVGIVLRNNKIIHASGKVRIDKIDSEGIVNSETKERTHILHSIRRYKSV